MALQIADFQARLGLLTMVIAAASSCTLQAQHQSRNLSGVVTDRHREPLRGAVVQAHNLYTQSVVSYITGRDGAYSFKRMDGDCDYKISATWHDRHSAARNLSLFDGNRAKVINLKINSQ